MSHTGYGYFSYPLGNQGTREDGLLETFRSLYRGDRAATVGMLKARFIAFDVSFESALSESHRNFPVENELKAVLDKRIDGMPNTFSITHEEEPRQEAADEWAGARITARGRSLYASWNMQARDQELDGNVALILSGKPDALRVAVRDTVAMTVDVDQLSGKAERYRFAWSEKAPGGEGIDYMETIDATSHSVQVGGRVSRTVHGYGFIPVVVIPREEVHGSPVGVSAVSELIEAYAFYLWSVYLLNVANKYEAGGIYCPDPASDTGAMLPDDTTAQAPSFRMTPGGYFPIPTKKVGGNITAESIRAQIDNATETLYRLGKVKRDRGDSGDMRSGKALLIGTLELMDYVQRKLSLMRDGLVQLLDMWAWARGETPIGEPSGYGVEFPAIDDDDASENTKRGELWMKAEAQGVVEVEDMLQAWQRLKLLDEDADVLAMATRIRENRDASEASEMQRMADTIKAQQDAAPAPQEDDVEEDEDG